MSSSVPGEGAPRYWWVNHPQAFRPEVDGSCLWAAKKDARGARNAGAEYLTQAVPGDGVFSFAEGKIGAAGVVTERARSAPRPAPAGTARRGRALGWLLPVRLEALASPLPLKDHMARLGPLLPAKHAPVRPDGARNAALYLAPVPQELASVLRELLAGQVQSIEEQIAIETDELLTDEAIEERIWQRAELDAREKLQLISARSGQGLFRENVERIEKLCRVTGVPDRRHLRASHIKPWKVADDREKLDGFNGLLLAPHIEHLFGRGHISFADDGRLMISRHLNPTVAKAWGLDRGHAPRSFRAEQRVYLEFHRRYVFEKLTRGRRG